MSSHVLAELQRIADYIVLLCEGRVQVAGEVVDLIAGHLALTGPTAAMGGYPDRLDVVHAQRGNVVTHLLIRVNSTTHHLPPGRETHRVSLEELALAYLCESDATALPAAALPAPHRCDRLAGAATRDLTLPRLLLDDCSDDPVEWRRKVPMALQWWPS